MFFFLGGIVFFFFSCESLKVGNPCKCFFYVFFLLFILLCILCFILGFPLFFLALEPYGGDYVEVIFFVVNLLTD